MPTQKRSMSAGSSPVSVGRVLQRCRRLCSLAEHRLDVAVGEPALLARLADLLERVAALAQAGDDPRVGDARPASSSPFAVDLRDHAPRAQRLSVRGDTPTRSAASFSVRLSATAPVVPALRATAEWKGSLRRRVRAYGPHRRPVTSEHQPVSTDPL